MLNFLVFPCLTRSVIERGICKVNIDGKQWDFNPAFTNVTYEFEDSVNHFKYFYKPCDALDKNDLPRGASVEIRGANMMRLNEDTNEWEYTNYLSEFDWTPKNITISFNADGQLFKSGGGWSSVDIEFDLMCDPISVNPKPNIFKSISYYGNRTEIIITATHSVGCSTDVPAPSPTPEFHKVCEFVSRMDSDPNRGIDAHFDEITSGPYGLRSTVTYNNKEMALYLKPCDRMLCPPPYVCEPNNSFSNVWLCPLDPSDDKCRSFGVSRTDINPASLPTGGEAFGFELDYYDAQTNLSSKFTVSAAESDFPDGYMYIDPNIYLDDRGIRVKAKSHEADLVNIPIPPIPSDKCTIRYSNYGQSLDLNLSTLNPSTLTSYYKWNVTVQGVHKPMMLYYRPCGPIICPAEHDCNGVEDGTVFLCLDKKCRAYGEFDENINFSLVEISNLSKGVISEYFGLEKKTYVTYTCDPNLNPQEIDINNTRVELDGTTLKFVVRAKAACPSGTPPEPFVVPKPPEYPTPPTPMRSPNPHNIIHNTTHYVSFNLDDFKNELAYMNTKLRSKDGKYADVHFEFSPWKQIPCPQDQGICKKEYPSSANGYMCFDGYSSNKFCYPYADVNFDQYIEKGGINIDDGVLLKYNSFLNVQTVFKVYCDEDDDYDKMIIPSEQEIQLEATESDQVIYLKAKSNNACPVAFGKPTLPKTPQPTPLPQPVDPSKFHFTSKVINDQYIDLDLSQIPAHKEEIVMGTSLDFERATIQLDFDLARDCGQSDTKICLGGGQTFIWKCVDIDGKQYCYGIGDPRQKLSIKLTSDDLIDGVTAIYGGGYAGYTTAIQFLCNESVPYPKVDLDDIAYESNMFRVTLYAHTSAACPKKYIPPTSEPTSQPPTRVPTPGPTSAPQPTTPTPTPEPVVNGITGGAIFLSIVFLPLFAYIVLGILINGFILGKFELPFLGFWEEFYQNFIAGAIFVFTFGHPNWCGAQGGYDQI